jgi:hypothetical protein
MGVDGRGSRVLSAAGIRQLELYSVFPSKEALLCRLAQRAVGEILEGQAEALKDPNDVVGSLQMSRIVVIS